MSRSKTLKFNNFSHFTSLKFIIFILNNLYCGLWWSVVICGGLWYLDSPLGNDPKVKVKQYIFLYMCILTMGCSKIKLCWCIGHMMSRVLCNILYFLGNASP